MKMVVVKIINKLIIITITKNTQNKQKDWLKEICFNKTFIYYL